MYLIIGVYNTKTEPELVIVYSVLHKNLSKFNADSHNTYNCEAVDETVAIL